MSSSSLRKKEYDAVRYQRNKERIKARSVEYYKLNKEACLEKIRAYQATRKEEIVKYRRARYLRGPEIYAAQRKKWRRDNPGTARAYVMAQHARKLRATPKWADQEAIKRIYDAAVLRTRQTGTKWVVDHIYPLKSPFVCGLHTEANLQIITHVENSRKCNKMPEDAL